MRGTTLRNIIIILNYLTPELKRILKATREKKIHVICWGTNTRMTADYLSKQFKPQDSTVDL